MKKLNDELIEVINGLFKESEKGHLEVLQSYKQSKDRILNYFNNLFTKLGKEGKIEYADLLKYNRLDSIEEFLKEEAEKSIKEEIAVTTLIFMLLYSRTYYQIAYTFEKVLGNKVNFKRLKDELVESIVKMNWNGIIFDERIRNNHLSLANKLRTDLADSVRKGETIDLVASKVEKQFGLHYSYSTSLLITEGSRIIGAAEEDIFRDSKIVEGVEFSAVLDNRTTEFCRGHDGRRYRLDDPNKPFLPAHIRCRSIWLPILINTIEEIYYNDNFESFDEWLDENIN